MKFSKLFFAFSSVLDTVMACKGSVGEGLIQSTNPKRICRWDYTIPSGSKLYMIPKILNMDTYCLDSIDIFIFDRSGKSIVYAI